MQSLNALKWAKIIKKKLDQLQKNDIWEYIYESNLKLDH